tara:strand:- start:539 stop:1447 length:909 start_codon:yes stop_codon:yes gene_type:complete
MKNCLYALLFAGLLASCGGSKQAVSTAPAPVVVIEEKVIINDTPNTAPEVETDIMETPESPEQTNQTPPVVEIDEPTMDESAIEEPFGEAFDHKSFNTLLVNYVSPKGNVNYPEFKKQWSTLRSYIAALGENMPTEAWTKNDKFAYWMNAYNAMTIDLILRNHPLTSIKKINDPWDQRLWKLGSKWYNLDEIEHQILRKMGDPRIHFGINCASFSCPPLLNEAFTAETVDAQLEKLAIQFINDSKRNTITTNSIEVSKIFNWFSKDFKTDGSLIDFLNKYSETPISPNAKTRYMDYDWTLNN